MTMRTVTKLFKPVPLLSSEPGIEARGWVLSGAMKGYCYLECLERRKVVKDHKVGLKYAIIK
jgi:hypothetical protein